LRKAISKKKKEEIDKHRNKFVSGAEKRGMERNIAEAIYSDWEEFARYGFNKSHAADYGVIAVQTAYLKAHYPTEYMTALLSASAGQIEKVAFYVADARSMGVPVLPIDINASGWDFQIEDTFDAPSIRFGLGAVKNVGRNAVELILRERDQNGAFKDINDFVRRTDLRAVGKRALECLIKVGALDAFGNRAALLASLERIVAISAAHFRAADAGQMSLFGTAMGVVEEIHLPEVNDVNKRETLNWERELTGLYISDHPLTPYQKTFSQIVSYFSGQLSEAQHEEKVRVAGLVSNVRPYTTKTNKPMGFVTLEDIQGSIELVLFPRTWEKTRGQLIDGQIVIVEGKVDAGSAPPKILVDTVQTEFKYLERLDETAAPLSQPQPASPQRTDLQPQPVAPPAMKLAQSKSSSLEEAPVNPAIGQVVEQSDASDNDSQMPPPPDNFPIGWENEWQPSFDEAAIASKREPKFKKNEEVSPPRIETLAEAASVYNDKLGWDEAVVGSLKPMYIAQIKEEDQTRSPKQITVTLR
ncbi:MAG TPA: OB-fold nucleic acid binding domain-containing protein, partial [Anaerolineales bacterium]|nr:OB-fold nucleic acid binding domain-containing protein [Anaerolineales bacterium]